MTPSKPAAKEQLIGVISDTHGLVRSEVVEAFQGCELIIHAGDVGKPEVLEELRAIAPVVAVRGNVDRGTWAEELSPTEVVEVGEVLLYVRHDPNQLDLDPVSAGFRVVISGHTHVPVIKGNEVLYVNPGAAGPGPAHQPVTVARLHVCGHAVEAELVEVKEPVDST